MTSESPSEVLKAYYDTFSAESYFEYFVQIYEPEKFFLTNLQASFESGTVSGDRILDFSCGPVSHRLALASKYCQELTFSEFSEPNRKAIRNWLYSNVTEPSQKLMLEYVASLEGFEDVEEGAKIITERTKTKSTGIIAADIHNPSSPLSPPQKPFDIVYSGAVLESVCLKPEHYVPAVKNLMTLIKPGGFFICSGFTGGDYYTVGGVEIPKLAQTDEFIQKRFVDAGLKILDFKSIVPNKPMQVPANMTKDLSNSQGCFFAIAQNLG